LRLALEIREVGYVIIVSCNGRIVAGSEAELLSSQMACLSRDRRAIVLNMGEVAFIDSSGLGAIVRALSNLRRDHGDLKLCNLPEFVRKVLETSHLAKLFETYDSEEKAVAAFYGRDNRVQQPPRTGPSVLCVDANGNILAYLRELLLGARYDVHTSSQLGDALMLLRVSPIDVLVIGPGVPSAARDSLRAASIRIQVIELGEDFSTLDAGEAAAGLLLEIESRVKVTK
jgi:anti-sigma B factor antagonist